MSTNRRTGAVVGFLMLCIFAAMAACTAAADGTLNQPPLATTPAPTLDGVPAELDDKKIITRDIRITSCKLGDFDMVKVKLTVKNQTKVTLSYVISGEVVSGKGIRLGSWTATTTNLAPGQTARLSGLGGVEAEGKVDPKLRCRVVELGRF